MAATVIGIEIEGRYLSAAKVWKGWRRSVLEDFFFTELPEDPSEVENWEKVRASFQEWAGKAGKGVSIIASLPGNEAIPVRIHFPFRKFSKIEQVLKAEIEGHVPLSVDDSVVDFLPIGEKGGEGLDVIAVAAAKKTMARLMESLAALDIVPDLVTYSPVAALRTALTMKPSSKEGVLGCIHIGIKHVSFSLCEGGSPSFIRTFRVERDLGTSVDPGELNLSLDRESLLRDLQFTLRAYSQAHGGKKSIDHLVLSGGGTDLNSLAAQLESGLDIPCQPVDWENELRFSGGDILSPKNLARGASALGAVLIHSNPFKKVFDLRREEFARPQGWRELRKPIVAAAAAAILALGIGVADLSLKVQHAERRLKAAQTNVQAVLREVFPGGNQVINPGRQISKRLKIKTRRLNILMGNPAMGESALSVIARISAAVPRSLKLRLNQLAVDEGGITLKGVTLTFEGVDRIKNLLIQKGGFEKPEVKQARLLTDRRGVEFFLHIPVSGKRKF